METTGWFIQGAIQTDLYYLFIFKEDVGGRSLLIN